MWWNRKKIVFEKVKRCKREKSVLLPRRQTPGSAAYDFYTIDKITIPPYKTNYHTPTLIKTGIKAKMPQDTVLIISNRSSSIKRGIVLANGIGIIDSDYYGNEDNDGEIMFAFLNISSSPVEILKGERIGQGFFTKILFAQNDLIANKIRKGGFGSTG